MSAEIARQVASFEPGDTSFVYLSGAGTKRNARMMWARVKAEAEDRLSGLGLSRHVNVRPGGILPMTPTGASKWVLGPLLKLAPSLGIGKRRTPQALLFRKR